MPRSSPRVLLAVLLAALAGACGKPPPPKPPECATSVDCAAGLVCVAQACAKVACTSNDQCAAPDLCSAGACVAGPLDAAVSTVTVDPADGVAADGVQASTVRVAVKDAKGNPVAGQQVQVALTGEAHATAPTVTDAQGVSTCSVTSTKAEATTVTVTVAEGARAATLEQKPTITFVPGAFSAEKSTLTASIGLLLADGLSASTLTVTLRDAQGNALAGRNVRLGLSGDALGGAQVDDTPIGSDTGSAAVMLPNQTGADGSLAAVVRSTAQGQLQVALLDPSTDSPGASVTLTFASGPVARQTSETTVTGSPAIADGSAPITIDVVLRDVKGNPVQQQAVTLALAGSALGGTTVDEEAVGAAQVSLPATDAEGRTSAHVRSTSVGQLTASVSAGEVPLGDVQLAFVAGPVDPQHSSLSLLPSLARTGATGTTVTVVLRDALGHLVVGAHTAIVVTPAQGVAVDGQDAANGVPLVQASGVDGVLVAHLTASSEGVREVGATNVSGHASVEFLAPLGVSRLDPAKGAAGTTVTITGSGFSTTEGAQVVTFNGVPATITAATATTLTVSAPASTSGPVVVEGGDVRAESPSPFVYVDGTPKTVSVRSLARDGQGRLHRVVVRGRQLVHQLVAGGTTTEATIASVDSAHYFGQYRVVITSRDQLVVVYVVGVIGVRDAEAPSLATWTQAGGWTAGRTLRGSLLPDVDAEYHEGFDLAVDAQDAVHVLVSYYPYAGYGHLDYYVWNAALTQVLVSKPALVNGWTGRPTMVLDEAGSVHFVFDHYYPWLPVTYAKLAGDTLTTSDLANREQTDLAFGLALQESGGHQTVWISKRDAAGQIQVSTRTDGGAWATELTTSETGLEHATSQLALVGGQLQLFWLGPATAGGPLQLRRAMKAGGSWGAPQTIGAGPAGYGVAAYGLTTSASGIDLELAVQDDPSQPSDFQLVPLQL